MKTSREGTWLVGPARGGVTWADVRGIKGVVYIEKGPSLYIETDSCNYEFDVDGWDEARDIAEWVMKVNDEAP